jgi:hypothetical protein
MRDLDELFGTLDKVPAPDVQEDARSRLAHVDLPMPPLGNARARRLGTIAVALLVFLAPALYAWQGTRSHGPVGSVTPAATDPLSSIPQGWMELPPPPEPASGTASVWTGTELISWGGYLSDSKTATYTYLATGSAFDPSSNTWSPIPAAPEARSGATPVWTGSEALFLFGQKDTKTYRDGVSFDPATGRWRTVAAAPIDPDITTAVWTGSEFIAWGSQARDGRSGGAEGAVYDPASDTWRRIADAPISLNLASGVWTGHRMIVFGSLLDNGNHAASDTAVGASYDPATDTWTSLPASDLSPQATSAVWTDDGMLAWDYLTHSQTYDPRTDTWGHPVRMPLEPSECYPDSVGLTGFVFAFYCGDATVYDEADGTWQRVHGGMLDATVDSHGNPIQLWRFAGLTPADDVVFLEAEGITVSNNGTPCYGCSGSPTSFWVYRP